MRKAFILLCFLSVQAQLSFGGKKLQYLGIAVNNFVSAKPVSGFPKLFYSAFHPGITVSTGFNWKEKEKSSLLQTFKVGFFNHRFIQHSFVLYSEFGYRYKAGSKWGLTAALGAGYLHMIPGTAQFRKTGDGDWEKVKLKSRPQGLISLSLGVDYKVSEAGNRIFIRYQNMLQTPFVPGYVPLLPYNVLHLGYTIPMSQLKKGGKDAK